MKNYTYLMFLGFNLARFVAEVIWFLKPAITTAILKSLIPMIASSAYATVCVKKQQNILSFNFRWRLFYGKRRTITTYCTYSPEPWGVFEHGPCGFNGVCTVYYERYGSSWIVQVGHVTELASHPNPSHFILVFIPTHCLVYLLPSGCHATTLILYIQRVNRTVRRLNTSPTCVQGLLPDLPVSLQFCFPSNNF